LRSTPKNGAVGTVRAVGRSAPCPVLQVDRAVAGDPGAFLTWICDYARDDIKYRTLSNARPFCFTATMNGCTFAIGSAGANGVLTVSHANAFTVGQASGLAQQGQRQKQMAVRNEPVRNFDPNHYDVGAAGGEPIN